jgi:acetyl esterase/lipase
MSLIALALAAEAYTAQTTYAKLAPRFPGIEIASSAADGVLVRRNIVYSKALQLDLYLPQQRDASVPGIVYVHGGGWRSGTRDNLAPMAIRMARRGYAGVTVSYRLSGEARYPAAVDDVRAAVQWMQAHGAQYGIDPKRVIVAGASAGGQIASLVGVTTAGVRAVVNIDGLSDFTSPEALRHEDDPAKHPSAAGAWFGGRYAEKSALWREASPTFYVGPATPPMLFIGSGEARFSVGREAMVEKLKSHAIACKVVVFPGTPHSFWLFDPWLDPTIDAMAAFLGQL